MATRNQVLSLFGATPAQIQEQQRQKQAEMILSQRDPYAKTGAALGTALAGLFGGKTPEVERAEQLQKALGQVQFDNPESMYTGAEMLNTMGFSNEAVQLLGLAQDRAMNEQRMATSKAQEIKAGFIPAPRFVGYVEKPRPDGLGGFIMTQEPQYETTQIPVAEYEDYLNKKGKYENWYPSAEQASATGGGVDTPTPTAIVTTGVGVKVGLVGDDYYIIKDDGTIGPKVEDISSLGGIVAPATTTTDSTATTRSGQVIPQSTTTSQQSSRGQMNRSRGSTQRQEEETTKTQRSNRRRSNAR